MDKTEIAYLRNLSVEEVASSLGFSQDKYDRKKWRGSSIISVELHQNLFYDHLAQTGGKGAIDLVIHCLKCDFKEAIAFLGGDISTRIAPAPTYKKVENPPLKCNRLDPRCWKFVKNYLLKRGLSDKFLDYMYQHKYVAADSRFNVVFMRYSIDPNSFQRVEALGASLRSTTSNLKLLSPGTKRDLCWFFFQTHTKMEQIYLTESAIDAMSLATLNHQQGKQNNLYISVDGCGSLPVAAISSGIASKIPVYTAFDRDEAGRQMSENVAAQFPKIESIYPSAGKDWNECLLSIATENQYFF